MGHSDVFGHLYPIYGVSLVYGLRDSCTCYIRYTRSLWYMVEGLISEYRRTISWYYTISPPNIIPSMRYHIRGGICISMYLYSYLVMRTCVRIHVLVSTVLYIWWYHLSHRIRCCAPWYHTIHGYHICGGICVCIFLR